MRIYNEGTVVAGRTHCVVQQGVDVEGIGLTRLVGHLGRGLIHIDEVAIAIREAHRHAGTGEHARSIVYPGRRPVVVGGVQTDAVLEFYLGLGIVVTPADAVHAMRLGRRHTRELRSERSEQARVVRIEFGGCPVGTGGIGVHVHANLKPLRHIGRRLRVWSAGCWPTPVGNRYDVPRTHCQSATEHPAGLAARKSLNRWLVALPL